jgi:Putative Flp pilus-assembly TadE/G-like
MRDHLRVTKRRHGEEGQIFLALLGFGIVILAVSLVLFQVGRAADLRTKGQTGADAAALAGARDVRTQFIILLIRSLVTGTPVDLDELLEPPACAEALAYAEQNNSTITKCSLDKQRMEITVDIVGNNSLGNSHEVPDQAKFARASATATAKVQILPDICGATQGIGIPGGDSLPGLGGGGNSDCDFNGLPGDVPDFSAGDFLGFLKIKLIN